MNQVRVCELLSEHMHRAGINAERTSPFRLCRHEKRFHFCFVPANTIGNMNKTQANRTQTAAAAAGYMGEWSPQYVWDSLGTRGD